MIRSLNRKFEISVLDSALKNPLPVVKSKEDKVYIVTEANQSFIIKLIAENKDIVYGAKLYLDGKEAVSFKTFKSYGHFLGFKLGNGNYKEFIFGVPPVIEENSEKASDEFGTINIKFYETYSKVFENKSLEIKKEYKPKEFKQSGGLENKKFFERSLSIREGNFFSTEVKQFESGTKRKEHFIDYEKEIDSIIVNYSDFVAMQIMGIISLRNVSHLKLIPDTKWDKNYAIATLEAILGGENYTEGINVNDIEEIFLSYTNRSLRSFIEGDLYNFFQTKSNKFKINDLGIITLSNRKLYKSKFCEIPGFIDKSSYFVQKTKPKNYISHEILKNKRGREQEVIIKIDD
jgi:hypothetical protein